MANPWLSFAVSYPTVSTDCSFILCFCSSATSRWLSDWLCWLTYLKMYFSSWLASYGLVGERGAVCCSKQLRQSSGVGLLHVSPCSFECFYSRASAKERCREAQHLMGCFPWGYFSGLGLWERALPALFPLPCGKTFRNWVMKETVFSSHFSVRSRVTASLLVQGWSETDFSDKYLLFRKENV